MKEFIEKLIGRLEESKERYEDVAFFEMNTNGHTLDFEYSHGKEDGVSEAIEIVNELAEEYKLLENIEQLNNGWIPVSGKLPNDMEQCLVMLENGCVMFATYIIDEFMSPIGHFVEGNKPIAWMPLPAPYKEGE